MSRWLCALLVLLPACEDGVGRAIVGPVMQPPMRTGALCLQPSSPCNQGFVSTSPFVPPMMFDYGRKDCAPATSMPCQPQVTSSCTEQWTQPNDLPAQLSQYSCLFHDVTPAVGATHVVIDAQRSDTRINLHATTPTTFEMVGAKLDQVTIVMSGPITLSIDGDSMLSQVNIESDDAVSIELLESLTDQLYVLARRASLRATRTRLDNAKLFARDVTLESCPISTASVSSQRLVGIQLRGSQLSLDVEDTSLSEVELSSLSFARCNSALLVNTRLSAPSFAPCTERLNVASSALDKALVFGSIESHDSSWSGTRFGSGGTPTELNLWGGSLSQSTLCPALGRVTIWNPITLACNDCQMLPTPALRLCTAKREDDAGVASESDGGGLQSNINCPQLDEPLAACNPQPESTSLFD